ncbi:MAG: cold shock domain-containing protein [Bacteroidia bacterium]|nr:cold shock domain-containing protein [Bacteroidia bacterium]
MKTGRVKFFNQKNKFGFIEDLKDKSTYYVHIKDLSEMVNEGDEVEFEAIESKRGLQAIKVKKIKLP